MRPRGEDEWARGEEEVGEMDRYKWRCFWHNFFSGKCFGAARDVAASFYFGIAGSLQALNLAFLEV